jgi:CpeT protein
MIDEFRNRIIGTFENKRQAFRNPSRFAYVRIVHSDVDGNLIYGEQAYKHSLNAPYRKFVLEPVMDDGRLVVKNYTIKDPNEPVYGTSYKDSLTYREGCDILFNMVDDVFVGSSEGCDCLVNRRGKISYFTTKAKIGPNYYHVIDRGYDPVTKKQMWGTEYGPFEFTKQP